MSFIRLQPHMYLYTPLGVAEAHFVDVPDSLDAYVIYGCFQCETKENWWWKNTVVRLAESISADRSETHSPIHISDELLETLRPHILRHKKSPFYEQVNR